MKKLIALMMALLLPLTAMAATVTEMPEECYRLLDGGLVVCRDYDGMWLVDAGGLRVSETYDRVAGDGFLAVVATGDGLNAEGAIDNRTGEVIMPMQYGDVEMIHERWYAGVVLTPSNDPKAPYYDREDNRYDVLSADMYFGGKLVCTLTGAEYGNCEGFGDYLCVINDENILWLDATGAKIAYERYSEYRYEYRTDRETGAVIHNGSNTEAFVPGCTLTRAQVRSAFTETEAGVVDLQGNVLMAADAAPEGMQVTNVADGYVELGIYDHEVYEWHKAVMKADGTVIIPFTLGKLPNYYTWYAGGVLTALTLDGQLCLFDADGKVLASMAMPEGMDTYDFFGFFESARVLVFEGENGFSALSADAGLMDLSAYADVRLAHVSGLLFVQKDNRWGCIDSTGAEVVPCMFYSMPEISADGALLLGYTFDSTVGYTWLMYDLTR